ncbi:MAG: hypothetical protein GY778_13500 [bacterium]|nr:hypothetical protein [bacterium]
MPSNPERQPGELIVDLFAGGGGANLGIRQAFATAGLGRGELRRANRANRSSVMQRILELVRKVWDSILGGHLDAMHAVANAIDRLAAAQRELAEMERRKVLVMKDAVSAIKAVAADRPDDTRADRPGS